VNAPAAVGEIFNVGTAEEVTIAALAQRVKELTQSDSEIVRIPYDEAYAPGFEDMLRRVPDISKIDRVVGWQPSFRLDQTLQQVIEYTQNQGLEPAVGS
jgi:UDP-glucose 4-epimerase